MLLVVPQGHTATYPNILDVNLHLLGFNHTLPSDVDMLLRAPQGLIHLVPFSDIGSEPIQNVDLLLMIWLAIRCPNWRN
ncbi:MAG: hypothetical protein IPL28_09065 [Chloroflexi bacterium]|nr:hypothetical protein [Chloroflexota bacterium]